jgi:hypothetical protein
MSHPVLGNRNQRPQLKQGPATDRTLECHLFLTAFAEGRMTSSEDGLVPSEDVLLSDSSICTADVIAFAPASCQAWERASRAPAFDDYTQQPDLSRMNIRRSCPRTAASLLHYDLRRDSDVSVFVEVRSLIVAVLQQARKVMTDI